MGWHHGPALFATNCAACHGAERAGRRGHGGRACRPTITPRGEHGLSNPPDFTDPRILLGASPALLEGKLLRGGMGTGMPYWGPIFTEEELDALIGYLYTFAW